jgi:3'-phosphoadenosine 5'-phosphosulfate sulfotransferase (PAPS reductase)/FAD synthetase
VSSTRSPTEADLEALPAEELLTWAAAEFGEGLCLSCSWQKQSSVLVHMFWELGLTVDVVELDTHLLFRESYETRERLVERYGLSLVRDLDRGAAARARGREPVGARSGPLLPPP